MAILILQHKNVRSEVSWSLEFVLFNDAWSQKGHLASNTIVIQARSQTFFCGGGGGGQISQIWVPFMITRGLSCDRVEFGHFGGGQMTPLTPPLATGLLYST